jgi:hypothetical protein
MLEGGKETDGLRLGNEVAILMKKRRLMKGEGKGH